MLDLAGALRLVGQHLCGDKRQVTLHRVDAAAILWRLHWLGEDVSAPCAQRLAHWDQSEAAAGHCAFNDLHLVLAMLGVGEMARAEGWVARCAARA